jgi:hypothetical protein
VRRALRRALDQAGVLQDALGPGVAQLELLLGDQPPVEMLGREVEGARPVLVQHPLDQALGALGLVAVAQAAEVPLAHPQHLRRLDAAQRPAPMASDRRDDPGHSDLR